MTEHPQVRTRKLSDECTGCLALRRRMTDLHSDMSGEIKRLRAETERARASADWWRESWEQLVGDLGEVLGGGKVTRRRIEAVLDRQREEAIDRG